MTIPTDEADYGPTGPGPGPTGGATPDHDMSQNEPAALNCLRMRIDGLRAEADELEALYDRLCELFGGRPPNEKVEAALARLLTPR